MSIRFNHIYLYKPSFLKMVDKWKSAKMLSIGTVWKVKQIKILLSYNCFIMDRYGTKENLVPTLNPPG